jgi:hypothetical protein
MSAKATERLIYGGFFISAIIMVAFIGTQISKQYRANETYTRFTTCVLSIPPRERTQSLIDRCWDRVIADTNVDVIRYDKITE